MKAAFVTITSCLLFCTACRSEAPIELGQRYYHGRKLNRQSAVTASDSKTFHEMTEAEAIATLIERLAISDEPAAIAPVFSPTHDSPDDDPRLVAIDAARQLRTYGKRAFPQLLAMRADNRQSIPMRSVIPHTLGYTCFCIVEQQIFDFPEGYSFGMYRTGPDGELHARPYSFDNELLTPENIEAWLEVRKDKSLTELQIEAMTWQIAGERKIGFQDAEDEDEIVGSLERYLDDLRKRVEMDRGKP